MINMKEQKGKSWYVFLTIGLLLGAFLGYYASKKNLLKQKVVGDRASVAYQSYIGNIMSNVKEKRVITVL